VGGEVEAARGEIGAVALPPTALARHLSTLFIGQTHRGLNASS
jgi:hypothetical protein